MQTKRTLKRLINFNYLCTRQRSNQATQQESVLHISLGANHGRAVGLLLSAAIDLFAAKDRRRPMRAIVSIHCLAMFGTPIRSPVLLDGVERPYDLRELA